MAMSQLERDCRSPLDQRSPLPMSPSFDVRLASLILPAVGNS